MQKKMITGDEIPCFQYDPENKRHILQWKQPTSPRPEKTCMSKSQVKTMLHFLRYQGYFSLLIHSTRSNSQPNLLCWINEMVTWRLA